MPLQHSPPLPDNQAAMPPRASRRLWALEQMLTSTKTPDHLAAESETGP